MQEIAYVNGEFLPLTAATVSVEDRGFQFSEGVYESVIAVNRRPFRLSEHLDRLKCSAEAIGLTVDNAAFNLKAVIEEGITRSGYQDLLIYVQITPGAAPRNLQRSQGVTPTVVVTFKNKPAYDPAWSQQGVAVETARDIRATTRSVKSTDLLPNVLLAIDARRKGLFDVLLYDAKHRVLEATSANVFAVFNETVHTPPLSEHILHGITRTFLLDSARSRGIPCEEANFTVPQLLAADEVFICSTTKHVIPVTKVDDRKIGNGKPGPITLNLLNLLNREIARECQSDSPEPLD